MDQTLHKQKLHTRHSATDTELTIYISASIIKNRLKEILGRHTHIPI